MTRPSAVCCQDRETRVGISYRADVAPLRRLRLISLLVVPLSVWLGAARPSFGAAKDDDASPSAKDDASEDSDAPKQKPAAASEKTDATKAEANDTNYGHVGQFGLRAGLVVGYRMILRYSDSPFCATPDGGPADSQQTFCGHGAPLATDLALSFGVLDFLEPFVWARLGFGPERQTDTNPLRVLGAGVRLYTMSDASLMRNIGQYRAQGKNHDGSVVQLVS